MAYTVPITDPAMLGTALQQARLIAGMTQRELAEKVGTSQRYIWEMESGKESVLLPRLLLALAAVGAHMYVDVPEGPRE